MLRLFVSVNLPTPLLEACDRERARLSRALGPLAEAVHFTGHESLHFTLKFLGWTPEAALASIRAELARAASNQARFRLTLSGCAAFPSERRPRVVYIGATDGAEQMVALAASVERNLEFLGFAPEKRPFMPHVTLFRVRESACAPEIGEHLSRATVGHVGSFEVTALALMHSELHPAGALHTQLASMDLCPEERHEHATR